MRLVRIVLSFLVLAFGFVAAMFLIVLGLIVRLFGGKPARPAVNVRFNRTSQSTPPRSPHAGGDVIDVEATPVKD
jgi:hypothetical protein